MEDYHHQPQVECKKSPCIILLTWKDKQSTHSKWTSYSLPENQEENRLNQLAIKINRPDLVRDKSKYSLVIELSLLGKGEEVIAMGSISPNFEFLLPKYKLSYLSPLDYSSTCYDNDQKGCYLIRPYFNGYSQTSYSKILMDVTIKVAQQDLPNVKTAKVEVKRN